MTTDSPESSDTNSPEVVSLSEGDAVEAAKPASAEEVAKETQSEEVQEKVEETKKRVSELTSGDASAPREITAATIGRMMGLATSMEIKLLEGKVDLLSTRINNLLMKLDKVHTVVQSAPSGADLERIDVQIGSLRGMLKEAIDQIGAVGAAGERKPTKRSKILSSGEEESPSEDAATPSQGA